MTEKQLKKLIREEMEQMEEDVSMDEWGQLKRKVRSILFSMAPEVRSEELKELVGRFGMMTFQDFLKAQNRMVSSSKGDLNKK